MKIFKFVVLTLSALALFYASSTRLVNPTGAVFLQSFLENPENSPMSIDLLNEIRGIGAVLFLGAIIAFLGIIMTDLKLTSFVVTTVILSGIVIGRSISFFIDGSPNQDLIRVAITEGILFALNIVCLANLLIKRRKL